MFLYVLDFICEKHFPEENYSGLLQIINTITSETIHTPGHFNVL